MAENLYFQVTTANGVVVRTTTEYWQRIITTKHPSIARLEEQVKEALARPRQIRRNQQDTAVYLYYKDIGNLYVCVVVDHLNAVEGYIITAYLTDRIKEGEQVYVKAEDIL